MQSPEMPPQPRLRLTEARLNRGLSQQDVAENIQTTHVNVSRWERGITKPSPYFRRKLSKLFGLSEEDLDLIPPAPASVASGENGTGESQNAGSDSKGAALESLPVNTDLPPIYDPAIPLGTQNPLVGRERELAQIKQRLQAGGSVALTALNGLPGVGKTALSIALAHDQELRDHFKDGILWAGLGPRPNMPGLLSRWGTLLGISANQMASLSNNEAWAKAIRNAIGTRTMLLVLDDAWVLEEALTVRVGGPNCAHLVTTRFPNIAAHMTIGGATIIQELGEEESIRLLRQLAPQAVDREAQKVHDLVQAVGGLPLALTLMGNYLRKQASSGPTRRISAALEKLSNAETRLQIEEPHVPAESHPSLSVETPLSLQSVIAVTDQLLGERARAALYALAVFPPKPNTFSEEAALVVAACTIDELDALSDSGLLEINGGERYQLHQIIADYARINLKAKELEEAQGRLVDYVVDYVEEHKKDYEMLELESGTILAAIEVAHKSNSQAELVRMVLAFTPFLLARGQYSLANNYLRIAYEAAKVQNNSNGLMGTLLYLGDVSQKQGDYTQAKTYFQDGLELARQADDDENISALLRHLGWVAFKSGEYTLAEDHLQKGLTLARKIENNERISEILQIFGAVTASQGKYDLAEAYFQEGLKLARQMRNIEQITDLLINLGTKATEQENYTQARDYFQEGLTLARQNGHREQICLLLGNLGDVVGEMGDYALSELFLQEGLTLARQIEHREWISLSLLNLGIMAQKQSNYIIAEERLVESLTLSKQINNPFLTSLALYECGNLYLCEQKIENAATMFQDMLNSVPKSSQELKALAQYGLARIEAAKGDLIGAQKLGQASVTTLEMNKFRNATEVRNWFDTLQTNINNYKNSDDK